MQQAQQKAVEATKSTAAANRKQPQSLGQAGYSSVLLKNKGGGGNTGGVSSAQGQGQQRVTSPSPVRSAFTPPGANHSFEPQSTGFFEMDSVQLDLRSPQAAADATTAAPHSADHQHLQQQHQPHAAHPIRSTAVPSSSSISPSKRSLNSHSHSSKYADVSLSRSPVRRSRSVPDMHADKDEVRALDPEEVARRQARAERLRRIVYPVRAQTAERIMQASTAYDEEDNSGKCSKQAQAVEGVLEAFAQLTVPSSAAITGFGSASAKVRHGSLRHPAAAASASVSASSRNSSPEATLHRTNSIYGTGSNNFSSPQPAHSMSMSTPAAEEDDGFFGESPMPPAGSSALYSVKFSPARRDLTSMEAQYCEVVNASTGPAMQECARNIAVLFRRLKENTKNNFNGQSDAVIGLPLMKLCVRRLGLVDGKSFQNNEADILLFHLGVKQLTLFGFALAVTLCAERALHSPLEGELGASTYIPKSYLGVVDFLNEKIIKLFRQMDSEHVQKTAFNPLDDYREISPECQNEVMKLLEREKKVFYAIYESYLPKSVKGFFDMRAALSAAPLSGGLPFSGIVNFGRDFEMSPHLLSRAQLLEIFNSILLAERELVQQALAEADVNASASASGKVHFAPETPAGGKTLSLDTAAPDNQRWSNRKNEFSAHSMSAKGDPAESISFPQVY